MLENENSTVETGQAAFPLGRKFILLNLAALSVLVVILVLLGKWGASRQLKEQEVVTARLATLLDRIILTTDHVLNSLATNRYIVTRLAAGPGMAEDPSADRDILTAVNSVKEVARAPVVYVMDTTGLVIASTAYDGDKTFTGNRYRFRPYFVKAMEGENMIYSALGVTSNRRGLYFSAPVRSPGSDTPLGVVVIKLGLDEIDRVLKSYRHTVGIMSRDGIVFAVNNPSWLFRTALPMTEERHKELVASRQFSDQPLEALPVMLDKTRISAENRTYGVVKRKIAIPGWMAFSVKPINGGFPVGPAIFAGLGVLLVVFLVGLNLVNSQKKSILLEQTTMVQEEARKQNEFLRTVLDSMSYPFYIINLDDYTIELANKASKRDDFLNYSTCYALTHGRETPCESPGCPMEDVKRTGKPVITEHVHQHPDGEESVVEVHAYPIMNRQGEVTRMIEYSVDVTHRKQMEAELLKNRQLESIGILAGGIAHDFNNLLSVIIGNITLVTDELDAADRNRRFLGSAEKSAMKAADLAQKLTTLSRGGWLEKTPVNLLKLVERLIAAGPSWDDEDLAPGTNPWQCTFKVESGEDVMAVIGDRSRLEQVLSYLIRNSCEALADIDAAERNVIQVNVANVTSPRDEIPGFEDLRHQKGTRYVRLSITDKGKGISKDNMPKIFDPYFSTKKIGDRKGTGLGLTLCYSILKKHGGYIFVQSEEGRGTTVDVFIPGVLSVEDGASG